LERGHGEGAGGEKITGKKGVRVGKIRRHDRREKKFPTVWTKEAIETGGPKEGGGGVVRRED